MFINLRREQNRKALSDAEIKIQHNALKKQEAKQFAAKAIHP